MNVSLGRRTLSESSIEIYKTHDIFACKWRMSPPTTDDNWRSYMSWREMASQAYNQTVEIPQLDHGLSVSYTYEGDSMCNKEFCRKVFQSRADRDRHEKLIHSELR